MELSDKRLTTICADIASAIDERGDTRLEAYFPQTCFAGRLARFLNSLRTDTRLKKLSTALLRRFAVRTNFNLGGIEDLGRFLVRLNVAKPLGEDTYEIGLRSIESVHKAAATYWRRSTVGLETTPDYLIVLLLDACYLPSTEAQLTRIAGSGQQVQNVLSVLVQLNLVKRHPSTGLYFSPKFFGERNEAISTFVDRTRGARRELIDVLEAVQECEGYDASTIEDGIRADVEAAIASGILEPIGVVVGGRVKNFLFSPGPSEDRLYLSKEATAHFRYNQRYPSPALGRLDAPAPFLRKLIREGTAGAATSIGTNYQALEEKGVVVAVRGGVTDLPVMVARKVDVLEDTLKLIEGEPPLKKAGSTPTLSEWVKNPPETRTGGGKPHPIDEHARLDLIKMLRDESR